MSWDPSKVGSRLLYARTELELSTRDVARLAGVSPQWISRVERGERNEISMGHMVALCEALHVRLEWVAFGTGAIWTVPPAERAG